MLKKIAFIALVVAALACGTWGYFYLQDLKRPTLKPFDVLPDSCSVLVEIKDPAGFAQQLTQSNVMWEEILKISDVQKFNSVLMCLDSLRNTEENQAFLGKEPFYIALYGKRPEAVFAFDLSDVNEVARTVSFFEKELSAKKIGTDQFECTLPCNGKKSFYVYCASGIVVASANKQCIVDIAEKNNKTPLSSNTLFAQAYKTAAKDKGLDVFVHFPYVSRGLWTSFFAEPSAQLGGADEKWIPMDLDIQPSDVNLHGFLPIDSLKLSNVVRNQEADDLSSLYQHLPYGTFVLEAVQVSDYGVFCRDNYGGDSLLRRRELKKYSDSLAASAQTEINNFIGTKIARVRATLNDTACNLGIVAVADDEKARTFFTAVADSVLIHSDTANLYFCRDKKLFARLSGGFFARDFAYVSVMNEMAVFSNSIKTLGEYRRSVTDKVNFSVNERAMQFIDKDFSAELNYLYYSDVGKNRDGIRKALATGLNKKLDESPELFEKFDAIGLSLQALKEGIFYKAQARFNPKNKMYEATLWETLADTDLCSKPVQVVNHKTGENELVFQDMANNLYLLSNTGKILWKKNVHERILGDVVQIDYFANGKLQIVFVAESQMHLIDRNGNYVDGFPVKIKAGASEGVSVFDYDNSKNYRFWIPLKNNTVICLNNACKAVEGFVPVNIKAPLARPIEHIMLQQKDYFVMTDTLGNIYAANRKGEPRLNFTNKIPRGAAAILQVGKDPSKTYLCYGKDEVLHKISLTDKAENVELSSKHVGRGIFFDTLQPTNGPLVVIAGTAMQSFDLSGNLVASYSMPGAPEQACSALLFGDLKVYACLGEEGVLHLLNTKTKKEIESQVKLSALPGSYTLIKGQGNYLVGYYRNKIFCIRP